MSRYVRIEHFTLAFFGLILGLVSFPNHALFRTYALDLGLYTHALWHYAHGKIHDSSLFLEQQQPILADHFDLYLPLFSPLVFLFGTWTLLIVQWIAVLLGAWGIRKFLQHLHMPRRIALVGMTLFLLYFGIFAAMAFDYHSNVVATMVLPWFLLALFQGKKGQSIFLFLFMLMSKENMGFWLGPMALILCLEEQLPSGMKTTAAGLGVLAITWSVLVIGILMPSLSIDETYAHFDYTILGQSIIDVPTTIMKRPWEILRALFVDHKGVQNGTAIKLEFWWMMVLAGGWAFFLRPIWGLTALPLLAQKMLHDDPGKWSVIAQYGVEFAPLLAIAVPLALVKISVERILRPALIGSVLLSLICTIHFMDRTVAYHDRSRIRIYQAQHYERTYDIAAVREVLEQIPVDAAVSAQSPAVPQLALREHLYQFPIIRDAEYIVLLPQESPYPLDQLHYQVQVEALFNDPLWKIIEKNNGVILMQRHK